MNSTASSMAAPYLICKSCRPGCFTATRTDLDKNTTLAGRVEEVMSFGGSPGAIGMRCKIAVQL